MNKSDTNTKVQEVCEQILCKEDDVPITLPEFSPAAHKFCGARPLFSLYHVIYVYFIYNIKLDA
jgi:hypothetical protein